MSVSILIIDFILYWFYKSYMPNKYTTLNNLKISNELLSFVNNELLKDTEVTPEKFWMGFDKVVHELSQKNKELILTREKLQKEINDWHIKNKGKEIDINKYKKFLKDINYLKDEGPDFKIKTEDIDDEIKNAQINFFDLTYTKLMQRMNEVENFYEDLLNTPFNFNKKEKIDLNYENLPYATNIIELKKIWRKRFKLNALETY